MKVIKFGGSSVADGGQLEKVKDIIAADSNRRIVVVSAPGKRYKDDVKVTDLLIELATRALTGDDISHVFVQVIERYQEVANELGIKEPVIEEITQNLTELVAADVSQADYYLDAIKASGEDNNAKLIAAYLRESGINAQYINPKEAGLFLSDEPGDARVLPESYLNLYKLRDLEGVLVFPGFFGYTKEGRVVTFSRGGSDITGAILANGVRATLYENFTDVDSIYVANPSQVENPVGIDHLTYAEMRELSYAGFSVFHDEALYPAFAEGIPVCIKNTNNPTAPGTMITRTRPTNPYPISGIASTSGFSSIYIKKYLMNREVGFMRRVLSVLEEFEVSVEHVVSGIDDMDVIFRADMVSSKDMKKMLEKIQVVTAADSVTRQENICLMMIVGEGMIETVGNTARATKALSEAGINLEMINQGSSETSVMFGLKEEVEADAVRAIYQEFFGDLSQ
ncbi:aspartate kinase [Aerococcus urinaehominis]|uniref:Aspartokinase n=1 Tax=Aerococcus urinaehominis TaxID=128944 RepID=A0A0X8FLE2_9LACT|nr:aspartate kinase [Aerococcus urinaehominis]AMB98767.1 aspartate kinase [Aerococcus urinaehominis]SDM13456.1 aspartate kinase [Aerococcus urinaehominis]